MSGIELRLVLMAALMMVSAFFSGAETALFRLEERDRPRAGPRVARLLADPQSVLITLLLANLLVNVSFFAVAAGVDAGEGRYGGLLVGLGALLALLIGGEILPKTVALLAPLRVARWTALPVAAVVTLLGPARRAVRGVLEVVFRILGAAAREERGITTEELARVLEKSAEHGLLQGSEAGWLAEVVELDALRVREIMTPRVDMLAIDLEQEQELDGVVALALERRLTWLPVVRGGADEIAGQVRLRELLVRRGRSVAQLVMPVKYVPEVASALDLLRELRDARASEAVVVDEWGGTAGIVTIEDLFEEIVGELRVEGEPDEEPVVSLGAGRFRVDGSLSVRDWNELFGHAVVPTEFETVGGLVTALLGRIPRAGDRVRIGDLVTAVHEVHGRRVIRVDLYVAPGAEASSAPAAKAASNGSRPSRGGAA